MFTKVDFKKINYEPIFEYTFYILFAALIVVSAIKAVKIGTDYKVFYFAGKRILEGNYELYDILRDGIFTFKYSPLFAVLMVPFSLMDYSVSLFVWSLMNSAFFVIGWVASEKIIQKNKIEIKFSHRLLTLLFLLDVVTLNAQQANINSIVFGLVMLGVYLSLYASNERLKYLGLFFIALISAIKITPIVLVLFYLLIKDYKKSFALAGMFAALLLLPLLYFGLTSYSNLIQRWAFVLSDTNHFPFYKYTNQSGFAQLSRWLGYNTFTVKFLSACLNTTLLLLVFYSRKFKDVILTFSLTIIFMLVASPISWKEYQVLLCLPVFYLNIKLINKELKGLALYCYSARIFIVNILVQAIIGEKLGLLANYHGNFLIGVILMAVALSTGDQ